NIGPQDLLIHVYHFMMNKVHNQIQNFGEPFFLVIREDETLAEIKKRIQKKLRVPNEKFAKWKFAFMLLARPLYLQDNDIVASRFPRKSAYGAWEQYLGLDHTDDALSSYPANQATFMESQQRPKPVGKWTIAYNSTRVRKLHPKVMNLPKNQSIPLASSSITIEKQPGPETRTDHEANVCSRAADHHTIFTETSQQIERVTPMEEDVEEAKTLSVNSGPLTVGPPSFQPQEPTVVEAGKSSSSMAEFDALFADIQSLLEGKTGESKNSSSFRLRAYSIEEIDHAKNTFKECLTMKLANVIQLGRAPALKNSFSVMLSSNAFPADMVNFTTKFLANMEQYAGAEQDLREVQEKEKSIGEMEAATKQLASEFMPLRNQTEAVDQEIAELERQLTEKKAKKARLRMSLEALASRATTSKQALIDAQEVMWLLKIKKEQAENMVGEMERSWVLLKSTFA
ncbi:Ubiquitin carboxyl-terminal hydrolase, C-terminal, partial [Trema orientale]